MIKADNLTKTFGFFTAVDSISFNVKIGEVVGFLGPNGAGKSTTMKMLTSYLAPTSGSIHIGDFDAEENPIASKLLIGYLPENSPLYKDMTVMEFLKFCASIRRIEKNKLKPSIEKVISICGLERVAHQSIDTLSKGYTRRTGLAQALIHDPPYLILDEPTDGLDPNQKSHIHNLIREMSKTKAILLSTHVLEEAQICCSRIIIIANGKIVAEGTTKELCLKNGGSLAETFRKLTLQ
ncbi:MAG: ATP-binding cassette domain-containing protein [Lentisphaerota bacterium]